MHRLEKKFKTQLVYCCQFAFPLQPNANGANLQMLIFKSISLSPSLFVSQMCMGML